MQVRYNSLINVGSSRAETHQSAFATISNGSIGLTIANRGLPEVEVIRLPKSGENSGQTEIAITPALCRLARARI
ncbi:MAG: hypothetical protein HY869_04415 [Chloroflexi bacterium]|nr:hypothetical protein [Chloroflexota bacterium]